MEGRSSGVPRHGRDDDPPGRFHFGCSRAVFGLPQRLGQGRPSRADREGCGCRAQLSAAPRSAMRPAALFRNMSASSNAAAAARAAPVVKWTDERAESFPPLPISPRPRTTNTGASSALGQGGHFPSLLRIEGLWNLGAHLFRPFSPDHDLPTGHLLKNSNRVYKTPRVPRSFRDQARLSSQHRAESLPNRGAPAMPEGNYSIERLIECRGPPRWASTSSELRPRNHIQPLGDSDKSAGSGTTPRTAGHSPALLRRAIEVPPTGAAFDLPRASALKRRSAWAGGCRGRRHRQASGEVTAPPIRRWAAVPLSDGRTAPPPSSPGHRPRLRPGPRLGPCAQGAARKLGGPLRAHPPPAGDQRTSLIAGRRQPAAPKSIMAEPAAAIVRRRAEKVVDRGKQIASDRVPEAAVPDTIRPPGGRSHRRAT